MKVLTIFQVQTERLSNLVLKMYNKLYLTLKSNIHTISTH